MGKANLAKKKQWRKLPSAEAALESELQTEENSALPGDQLYVEDRKGDVGAVRRAYPEKFASPKPPVSSKPSSSSVPPAKDTASAVFDLWGDATQSSRKKDEPLGHIPAVIPPKPGQSYNPEKESLKEAWEKVAEEETAKDKLAAEYQRAIHGYQVVETDAAIVSSDSEGAVDYHKNPPTVNKKPTKAKVNRKMRFLLKLKEDENAKRQKALRKAVDEIPKIVAEAESRKPEIEAERIAAEKRKREEKEAEAKGLKAPKLRMGQFVYRLPETEAIYSEEAKPLRQMRPKATVVDTCFDSLVRRGKVDLCTSKRTPKIITRNRFTGEISKEMQQQRDTKKQEAAAGTIKMPPGESH